MGNSAWLKQQNIDLSLLQDAEKKFAANACTSIYLVQDDKAIALFALQDRLREGADQLISVLKEQGMELLMVTGDTESSAKPVAEQLGIESRTVEASPAKKIQIIRELQNKGQIVAMIGDGINDAPALAAADVSLVVGNAAGIAIEAADFVLVDGDITKMAEMLDLSQQTLRIIKQNLFWSFAYNAVAIPVAMGGRLNPMISSAAMALSSVSVIINSLRLSKK